MIFANNNGCGDIIENMSSKFKQERSDHMSFPSISERFDTHRNHSMGAQSIYFKDNPEITLDNAERDAKYMWSVRDPKGMQLYDNFYEEKVIDEYDYPLTYSDDFDYDNDNQYDLKFETGGAQKYSQHGMREPQLRGQFRGNIITLAQKEHW